MDDSLLFLVHVWPAKPGFRASARRVDSDLPRLLNTPQELADYFADASHAAHATPSIAPRTGDPKP
jgi:hypothetical protein